MRKVFCSLIFLLSISNCFAQYFDPFEGRRPIFTLIQTDPWLMVMGSDTPMVCLYDDGTLIYFINENKPNI